MNANKNRMDTNKKGKKIIYKELSYKIVGMLYKIHNELGGRHKEKYYQRALVEELKNNKIKFKRELPVDMVYNNKKIGHYKLDFLIENKIILELKTVPSLKNQDFRQILSYLKSENLKLGIIANMRGHKVVYKRVINPDFKYSH